MTNRDKSERHLPVGKVTYLEDARWISPKIEYGDFLKRSAEKTPISGSIYVKTPIRRVFW